MNRLPTYEQSCAALDNGDNAPLHRFIRDHEPEYPYDKEWRAALSAVLDDAPDPGNKLRDRCVDFLAASGIVGPDQLVSFVVAETGRRNGVPDDSLPLCLYFRNAEDRAEFVTLAKEALGHSSTRIIP
jgi:hypothetical protein